MFLWEYHLWEPRFYVRSELWLLLPNITAKPQQRGQQISIKNTEGFECVGVFPLQSWPCKAFKRIFWAGS